MAAQAESKLRDARLKLGWSQAQLGRKLGVTGAAIGHYESGIAKPSADKANRLAKILGLKNSDIEASTRSVSKNGSAVRATSGRTERGQGRSGAQGSASREEMQVLDALRAIPAAQRRVVMDMVVRYGSTASGAARKRRG